MTARHVLSRPSLYIKTTLVALILCLSALNGLAQNSVKPIRILFLLDASSSMLDPWSTDESRFLTASRIIGNLADSIKAVSPDAAFALRVFGGQYPAQEKNCYDSKLEVSFSVGNSEQIQVRLRYLSARGYSPIAWSLKETAEQDFKESQFYSYSIVLITDGGESCGGDICATVRNLLAKKISFTPYILSLVDYAPLRKEYECLGKYLQVTNNKEIGTAIKTIIDDNRPLLSSNTKKPVETIKPKETAPRTTVASNIPKIDRQAAPSPRPAVKEPAPEPKPAPVAPTPVETERKTTKPLASISKRYMGKPKKMGILFSLPEARMVKVPTLYVTTKLQEEPPAARPKTDLSAIVEPEAVVAPKSNAPTPARASAPTPKKETTLKFTEQSEDAKESSLQIYFTNGRGKFYLNEPQILIIDHVTQKELKSLHRNVAGSEPNKIPIQEGAYDIRVPGGMGKALNVQVEKGKNKKVYIEVGPGSLQFYYPTAPTRPVKEYLALVSKRFEPGPVIKHRCDEILPYDPANYHIEINTLPPLVYNIDLDFNNIKLVQINEPGTIQIVNDRSYGKVQFWHQKGNAYVPFYEMDVKGDMSLQKADFQPGLYQVRYVSSEPGQNRSGKIIHFRIKSNQLTKVELY